MSEKAQNIIPFLKPRDEAVTIMVVDDDRLERSFLEQHILTLDHQVHAASNGLEALEYLQKNPGKIDVILMDRMMPVMDGLTAVRRIKDVPELRQIPIVMVTAATNKADIQEGLEAGVFYYITKPVDEKIFRSVLIAAIREARQNRTLSEELKKHRTSFNLIHTCKFVFRTLDEAECLAAFMAHCFPNPERALPGLAELLINAVEHGNLDVGYARKSELVETGTWRADVERRQDLEENMNKTVEAVITRKDDGVYAIITDQGQGFNWRRFMTIDPARASDNHGRGIAQANAISFDRLTYNDKGNQVVAFSGHEKDLEW